MHQRSWKGFTTRQTLKCSPRLQKKGGWGQEIAPARRWDLSSCPQSQTLCWLCKATLRNLWKLCLWGSIERCGCPLRAGTLCLLDSWHLTAGRLGFDCYLFPYSPPPACAHAVSHFLLRRSAIRRCITFSLPPFPLSEVFPKWLSIRLANHTPSLDQAQFPFLFQYVYSGRIGNP